MARAALSFSVALVAGLALAQGVDPGGGPGVPQGWVRYVNTAHRYVLWHPHDWEPQTLDNHSLYKFRVAGGEGRDFSVMYTPGADRLSLEEMFQGWRPNLASAEGARYLLDRVRERKLGANRALEIPMAPAGQYQATLWLVDVGGQKYGILAQTGRADATVRQVLASLRKHPQAAPTPGP